LDYSTVDVMAQRKVV